MLLLPHRRGPERPGRSDLQGSLDISSFPVLGRGEALPILLLPLLSSLPWALLMDENPLVQKPFPVLRVFLLSRFSRTLSREMGETWTSKKNVEIDPH